MPVHTEVYTNLYAPGEWDDALLPSLRAYLLSLPDVRRIVREDIGGTDEIGTRVSFIVHEDGPYEDGSFDGGELFMLTSPVDLVED